MCDEYFKKEPGVHVFIRKLMLLKRRFWKTEQCVACAFLKYFSRVWVLFLGYHCLKNSFKSAYATRCSTLENSSFGEHNLTAHSVVACSHADKSHKRCHHMGRIDWLERKLVHVLTSSMCLLKSQQFHVEHIRCRYTWPCYNVHLGVWESTLHWLQQCGDQKNCAIFGRH